MPTMILPRRAPGFVRSHSAALGLASALLLSPPMQASAQTPDTVVFAAASLKNALDEAAAGWEAGTGKRVTISYAASSALARQIEEGAPADVFISADLDWMDELARQRLIKTETRASLLGNEIVLVAPAGSAVTLDVAPGMDLAGALAGGKLAMANTDAVPAGKYGKAALEALGSWDSVKDDVAQAENVRAALALVSRGEAPIGIVYATDAAADPGVKVLGVFPRDSHPPIVYPIAVIAASTHPDAPAFAEYLRSAEADAIFETHGFQPLD